MRCVGHVAHLGQMTNAYKMLVEKPENLKGRDHLVDLGVDERLILNVS